MSPSQTFPAWFQSALEALRAGDTDSWIAIYADDAVHEFPFAPEGGLSRLEGRYAIAAYMRQIPSRMRFGTLDGVRVREAGDELIIEATGHHTRVADNAPRVLSYVWFVTRRDGKVTHFRDYMNPLQLSAR